MQAVADAGLLIHLSELGRADLLGIFDVLLIPDGVWSEAQAHGVDFNAASFASVTIARRSVGPAELQKFIEAQAIQHLHAGEIECLHLCKQEDIALFLTDDLAARDAAKRLGVVPVGSLGVVMRACRLGQIELEEAEVLLDHLFENTTLYVTRALIDIAIGALRRGKP